MGINVLSLFDGISCGQLALERAGIDVDTYYASEIDQHAISVTQHHYPNTIQLGSITDVFASQLPKIDLLIGGSPCFHRDTLIRTNLGLKRIEDVLVGDIVQTHTGQYKPVTNTFINPTNGFIFVKALGSLGIYVTTQHPFYVRDKLGFGYSDPYWIESSKLTKNHLACIPINKLEELPTWNGITKVVNQSCSIQENVLSNLFTLPQFWKFVGRWLGNGWTTISKRFNRQNPYSYKTIICCNHKEYDELVELFNAIGFDYSISKERTVYKFAIASPELAFFLRQFGNRSYNKELGSLLNLPNQYLEQLLIGIFDSDGYSKPNSIKVEVTSKRLVMDIQSAVLKVYKTIPTIFHTKRPRTCYIENKLVNQRDTYSVIIIKDKEFKGSSFIDDNYAWVQIRKVIPSDIVDTTFNFEVADDNSYVAENLAVHNCQGFSFNGKQLNFDDPRSALFFEYARLWNECKPKYWLLENVRMKRESEDVITKILGVKPIIINSRLVSAQNRHRLYWTNIPGISQPEDRNIHIDSILGPHDGFWLGEWGKSRPGVLRKVDKAPTVQCSHYRKYVRNGIRESVTTTQLEALQTLPIGYTSSLCKTRAHHAIGNGWTVDVIAHIFTAMKNDMNGIKVALDKFI